MSEEKPKQPMGEIIAWEKIGISPVTMQQIPEGAYPKEFEATLIIETPCPCCGKRTRVEFKLMDPTAVCVPVRLYRHCRCDECQKAYVEEVTK